MSPAQAGRSGWPDLLGKRVRVLVGGSVYEDATITIRDGRLFIEFDAADLEAVMVNLGDLR